MQVKFEVTKKRTYPDVFKIDLKDTGMEIPHFGEKFLSMNT